MSAASELNGTPCPQTRPGNTVLSLNNYSLKYSLSIGDLALNGFISTQGVVNFLKVPYARIPARFKTAEILHPSSLKGDLDATRYGPRCPQPHDPIHDLMKHMFEQLSMTQYSSEFDCLHLNIYAPPEALQAQGGAGKVPVFAWIHGGAFNCGDNTTEFDGNHLVKRSMELGKPIVVVAINYRLNVLGFLSSRELIAEACDTGETPIMNQGLNDQKIALQWIQQNIDHFGGDASRVTVSGESAGAASVFYQLKGMAPLFSRAIIFSCPRPSFRTLAEAQTLFDRLVDAAGISATAPYQVKLQGLRSYSAQDLIALIPELPVAFAIEDPNWFVDWDAEKVYSTEYWANLPPWCAEIVVGHTKDEGALFLAPNHPADLSESKVKQHLRHICTDPAYASTVLSVEPMKSAGSPLRSLIAFGTHAMFVAPILEFTAAASSRGPEQKVYQYSIDITDPFSGQGLDGSVPGPLRGYAWHSFGNAILFYQPACQACPELAATAAKMSDAYTSFMYGHGPWEAFGVKGRKMSWNGNFTGLVEVGLCWKDPVRARLLETGGPVWTVDYGTHAGWVLTVKETPNEQAGDEKDMAITVAPVAEVLGYATVQA